MIRRTKKRRAAEFHVIAKREAAAYTIRHLGSDRPLTLKPEPILKWSNPVKGSIYGDVFIWTENGRPEAVASIYKWYSPHTHRANEFHSLALDKLIGERDGVPVWNPSRPGLELKPIPAAPVPADSAAARLRQMRTLAQEFTGSQTSRQRMKRDMRLLTEPVYRYENTKGDLIDAGLFVFVVATDPDAFLLIEAHRTKSGAAESALRRDSNVYRDSGNRSPRSRGLERAGTPLVASVGWQRAVLYLPLRSRPGGTVRTTRRRPSRERMSMTVNWPPGRKSRAHAPATDQAKGRQRGIEVSSSPRAMLTSRSRGCQARRCRLELTLDSSRRALYPGPQDCALLGRAPIKSANDPQAR